jgi:hypothetical protein
MRFDWQTEDEGAWDEAAKRPEKPEPRRSRRRWLMPLIVLVAFLLAAWVVYRQVDQQVSAATTAVQEDVLSAHNLLQTAVAQQDSEIFRSLLSGRDPVWTESQEALLRQDLLHNRSFWGWERVGEAERPLTLDDLDPAIGQATLELSADLSQAILRYPQSYRLLLADGRMEEVVLGQTAVYRRGSQRWLLSPPDDDFWGETETYEADGLLLTYPQRDEAIALPLADSIAAGLRSLCQTYPEFDCPAGRPLALTLATDPSSLADVAQYRASFATDWQLTLPTPTLLGLPQTETGEQALHQAYAAQVTLAIMADLLGWECCAYIPSFHVFQVFADHLMHQIGLHPWPITSEDHARALRESVTIAELQTYWARSAFQEWPPPDRWELYAAADFLLQTYPFVEPVAWLRELHPNRSLVNWIRRAFGDEAYRLGPDAAIVETLDEAWWQFAYAQTLLAQQTPPPIPFPEQDVQLVCLAADGDFYEGGATRLMQYDMVGHTWTEVLTRTNYTLLLPFRDDSGWALQSFAFDGGDMWRTELWREGQLVTTLQRDGFSLSLGQSDPNGRFLVSYIGDMESETVQTILVDLPTCAAEECEQVPLIGQPYWSPNGRYTLLANWNIFDTNALIVNDHVMLFDASQWPTTQTTLSLGDGTGQLLDDGAPPLTDVYTPFWVTDDTFGYARAGLSGQSELLLQTLTDTEPRLILEMEELLAVAPETANPPVSIRYVVTHPRQPSLIFILAADALGRRSYLFAYDWQTSALELRLQSLPQPMQTISFSPDGRWLMLTGYDDGLYQSNGNANILYLHDIAARETKTFVSQLNTFALAPTFDWSADGRWLIFFVDDRVVSLVAPDYDYQWVFAHEQGNCIGLNWINRYE